MEIEIQKDVSQTCRRLDKLNDSGMHAPGQEQTQQLETTGVYVRY